MGRVVLDSRFLLCWLAPVVASFFALEIHMGGVLYRHVLKIAFYGFLLFYTIYFLLSFLPQKIQRTLQNILLILSLLTSFINFFCAYYFNMGFNQAMIDTILASNPRESIAFLNGMILPHSGVLVAYAAVCIFFLYGVRFKLQLPTKIVWGIFIALLVGVGLHSLRTGWNLQRGISGYFVNLDIASQMTPLIKETRALYASFKNRARAQQIYASFRQPYPKDYLKADSNSVDNVVLVVGESASRNFMGIYGYPVPNTPFLSGLAERERSQNLFIFTNTISPFSNTLPTLQVLLNYSDVENHAIPWYQQKNLGDILTLAGYKSWWLENQEEPGSSDARSLISRRFTARYYASLSQGRAYDANLLETFKTKVKPHLETKNFILFHLHGSHILYKERFPPSFAKFTPKDIPYQGLHVQNDKEKQIVADYVNSLYYTDHVLEGIFKLFENKDAIIFYLSDHAQDMFESANTYGHKCSNFGVEIPFVIYVTNTFKQKHPEKVKAIAGALNKPFMADDLIHSLLPLVGIHTKDNLESKNLFSPQFDTKRKRIYCDNKIYKHN
ncbi:phosphoethanolamine transferase [Helicobacter bizzozeronii]|uniref:phosphoethanolamine transferase n=1 Tax=Helicobacter bizzozeronii TaxID=56877 RepID=UPI001F474261|nr:phosphoethanolamine transferase [Helicobacter bizzozeronii]